MDDQAKHSLSALDPAFRRSVEAFIRFYMDRDAGDIRPYIHEDCQFEGAMTAGTLRGREIVMAHMKRSLHMPLAGSRMQAGSVQGQGRRVELRWSAESASGEPIVRVEGVSRLESDERGLIRSIRIDWDPRPLMPRPPRG